MTTHENAVDRLHRLQHGQKLQKLGRNGTVAHIAFEGGPSGGNRDKHPGVFVQGFLTATGWDLKV